MDFSDHVASRIKFGMVKCRTAFEVLSFIELPARLTIFYGTDCLLK